MIKRSMSPLKTMGIGAGVGAGAGLLLDFLMNNKEREIDYKWYKRPLLMALLGTIPGALNGGVQYYNSFSDGGYTGTSSKLDSELKWSDPLALDHFELMEKSPVYRTNLATLIEMGRLSDTRYNDPLMQPEPSLDKKFEKRGMLSFMTPNIPANAMTNSIYSNVNCIAGPNVHNIPNALQATVNRIGSNFVSPAQVATTLVNAGIGRATGAVIGKTLGALCGISPQSYQTLKDTGMYAGIINHMNNTIQKF